MPLFHVSTAQEKFERMLRDRVAPALRERGFAGSGQEFSLRDRTHWVQVGFQRDRWSRRFGLKFTVNVTVVRRDMWEKARTAHPWIGDRPKSRSAGYAITGPELRGYWNSRIGALMPRPTDRWWSVDLLTNERRLASEIVSAIDRYLLPAARRHMT